MRFADRLDVECERKVKDNSKVFDLNNCKDGVVINRYGKSVAEHIPGESSGVLCQPG